MTGGLAAEFPRFGVTNLANRPAIACDLCLKTEKFISQFRSPRFIQRLLKTGRIVGLAVTPCRSRDSGVNAIMVLASNALLREAAKFSVFDIEITSGYRLV